MRASSEPTDEAKAREIEAASGSPRSASAIHDGENHESQDQAGVGSERSSLTRRLEPWQVLYNFAVKQLDD